MEAGWGKNRKRRGKWKEKGGSNEVMKEKLGGKRLRETKPLLPIKLWISARPFYWRNYLKRRGRGSDEKSESDILAGAQRVQMYKKV